MIIIPVTGFTHFLIKLITKIPKISITEIKIAGMKASCSSEGCHLVELNWAAPFTPKILPFFADDGAQDVVGSNMCY